MIYKVAALALAFQGAQAFSSLPSGPGGTDHYLAATKDTVRWGYYDLDAPAMATMKSGETITVEVITHHSGHDYAKMIQGDPAVEEIFAWYKGESLETKAVPKPPSSGVHIITGPIRVEGAEPGDVLQVEILELDPRPNPLTGKTYGTNSAKFAGYQFRVGKEDGSEYTRDGGHEAITVFEFVKTESGKMAWGKPIYAYTFPTIEDANGTVRTFDGMPCVVIPHETNIGGDGEAVTYPPGFDGTTVLSDGLGNEGVIHYLDADFNWKAPLRPHLGTLAVMPSNTNAYANNNEPGVEGANTIPPSRFGGNVDDWRIGKGATMYYTVEVEGGMLVAGDTHAAQGDSELAGTAMETSMTAQLRVTLHKQATLPTLVTDLNFPLLETDDSFVVHGFAYSNYLDQLDTPSEIFAEGASVDLALEDCFNKTRSFLIRVFEVTEEESIALMSTGVDFGITQIVDGNWGVHATIPKWIFEAEGEYTPYDYSCTSNPDGRRKLSDENAALRTIAGQRASSKEQVAHNLAARLGRNGKPVRALEDLGKKLVDAKIYAVDKFLSPDRVPPRIKKALEARGTISPVVANVEAKFEAAVDSFRP